MSDLNNPYYEPLRNMFFYSQKDLTIPAQDGFETFIEVTYGANVLRSDYPSLSGYFPSIGTLSFATNISSVSSNSAIDSCKVSDSIIVKTNRDGNRLIFSTDINFSNKVEKTNTAYFYSISCFNPYFCIYGAYKDGSTGLLNMRVYSYDSTDLSTLSSSFQQRQIDGFFSNMTLPIDISDFSFNSWNKYSTYIDGDVYLAMKESGSSVTTHYLVFNAKEAYDNNFDSSLMTSQRIVSVKDRLPQGYTYYTSSRDSFNCVTRNKMYIACDIRDQATNKYRIGVWDMELDICVQVLNTEDLGFVYSSGRYSWYSQGLDGKEYFHHQTSGGSLVFEITKGGLNLIHVGNDRAIAYYSSGVMIYKDRTPDSTVKYGHDSNYDKIDNNGVITDLSSNGNGQIEVSNYYSDNAAAESMHRLLSPTLMRLTKYNNYSSEAVYQYIADQNLMTIQPQDPGNGGFHKCWVLGV